MAILSLSFSIFVITVVSILCDDGGGVCGGGDTMIAIRYFNIRFNFI